MSDVLTAEPKSRVEGSVDALLTASAVRERCVSVAQWVEEGRSSHFTIDDRKLGAAADYVAAVTRESYPDLNVPYHSRWRHFSTGGRDRWSELAGKLRDSPRDRGKAAFDLATISVLLDAGAGDAWRYRDSITGETISRSEGLAAASIEMFAAGALSSDQHDPYRVDAAALVALDPQKLAKFLQVDAGNPLLGFNQRVMLLRRLGAALAAQPKLFGSEGRPANIMEQVGAGRSLSASKLLTMLLKAYAPIWPAAFSVGDEIVGDAGRHPAIVTGDITQGAVPFHKLSQWLTYSLVEPLELAGLLVTDIDRLTGLPEYRNGGLLIDLGVIVFKSQMERERVYTIDSELVVEWRALTVALLDRLLPLVRERLGCDETFLLPHMLQGGTWAAGRKIAAELRSSGDAPLKLAINGTTF